MGMFANAMGNDCTFCHAPTAALDRNAFAIATPRIQRARQMIVMVNAINKTYFAGQPRVTCFTCHHGTQTPRSDPNLALQYGPPIPDPIARDFPTDATIMPNQVFDKHLQAIGGAAAASKLTSFTAKGTYEGFDTAFEKVPVEIFAKAPNQFTTIVHMSAGDSRRVYNGIGGWLSGPDTALPVIHLTNGNLDRARLEAIVAFPASLRNAFPQWRAGRTADDDQEYIVLQANENGQPVVNLYFDESGMLLRLVRFTLTPVGFVPTQIDYRITAGGGHEDGVQEGREPDLYADDDRARPMSSRTWRSTPRGSRAATTRHESRPRTHYSRQCSASAGPFSR